MACFICNGYLGRVVCPTRRIAGNRERSSPDPRRRCRRPRAPAARAEFRGRSISQRCERPTSPAAASTHAAPRRGRLRRVAGHTRSTRIGRAAGIRADRRAGTVVRGACSACHGRVGSAEPAAGRGKTAQASRHGRVAIADAIRRKKVQRLTDRIGPCPSEKSQPFRQRSQSQSPSRPSTLTEHHRPTDAGRFTPKRLFTEANSTGVFNIAMPSTVAIHAA